MEGDDVARMKRHLGSLDDRISWSPRRPVDEQDVGLTAGVNTPEILGIISDKYVGRTAFFQNCIGELDERLVSVSLLYDRKAILVKKRAQFLRHWLLWRLEFEVEDDLAEILKGPNLLVAEVLIQIR